MLPSPSPPPPPPRPVVLHGSIPTPTPGTPSLFLSRPPRSPSPQVAAPLSPSLPSAWVCGLAFPSAPRGRCLIRRGDPSAWSPLAGCSIVGGLLLLLTLSCCCAIFLVIPSGFVWGKRLGLSGGFRSPRAMVGRKHSGSSPSFVQLRF